MTALDTMITHAPRARGQVRLEVRASARGTTLAELHHAGSLRAVFPRGQGAAMPVVLTNTAGGVTGGDRFTIRATAGPGAALTLTTQAAERAYRAQPGQIGRINTRLTVDPGARLNWLPQETLLYAGCALDRRLTVDLAPGASALVVEPLLFGRLAMGETLTSGSLCDRIELRREGRLLFLDAITLDGDIAAHLGRPATAGGASALATLLFADAAAEAHLDPVRALLPATGGASLVAPDLLVVRLLAEDGFALRQTLCPLIERLSGTDLPRPWKL